MPLERSSRPREAGLSAKKRGRIRRAVWRTLGRSATLGNWDLS